MKIVDVLPSRHKFKLDKYFSRIPLSRRKRVLAVTIDMWETYKNLAEMYFPNAIIAIDSFHVIKMIHEAVQSIRKKHMMKYDNGQVEILQNSDKYYMLKKF
jgi:transposase